MMYLMRCMDIPGFVEEAIRRLDNLEKYDEFIREIDGEFHCIPISTTNSQQTILCPHCHELHRHGIGDGRRVAHCKDKHSTGLGYTITQSFD